MSAALLLASLAPVAPPSVLDAAGPQAAAIVRLWWMLFALCAFVYAIVMALTFRGVRASGIGAAPGVLRLARLVVAGVAATAVCVVLVLGASAFVGREIGSLPTEGGIALRVTGHQWWWQVEYVESDPSLGFETANEIHVPVGRPVALTLASADVIHSLWVPSLHGKRDLIPGRTTSLTWRADRPGVYRGMCAEFCGHQHAHMGLLVIAQPVPEFEEWRRRQRAPARETTRLDAIRGRELLLSGSCPLCHTIRGTPARGSTGPELTHLASRQRLAAATLPNTREALGEWIADPHASKPGNRMPASAFDPRDLADVVTYLMELE